MSDKQPIIDRINKIMGDYKLERKDFERFFEIDQARLSRRWGWQFVFWFTFGGAVVWWIVDLFRIPLMVNDYNQSVSVEVAKDAKNLA